MQRQHAKLHQRWWNVYTKGDLLSIQKAYGRHLEQLGKLPAAFECELWMWMHCTFRHCYLSRWILELIEKMWDTWVEWHSSRHNWGKITFWVISFILFIYLFILILRSYITVPPCARGSRVIEIALYCNKQSIKNKGQIQAIKCIHSKRTSLLTW